MTQEEKLNDVATYNLAKGEIKGIARSYKIFGKTKQEALNYINSLDMMASEDAAKIVNEIYEED